MTEQNTSDPRGFIQVSGPDSRAFLQGQVTCDMDKLTFDQPIYGAQCTAKGRIIFTFLARCDAEDNIVLETHSSITDIALASLKKYAVFFKTTITDVSNEISAEPMTDLQRLRTGTAEVTSATTDMFIPQMINLDALGYISFKKGCYTGQEIVARAHYRGTVKRRMHHLQIDATATPPLGEEIRDEQGKSIGTVASAVHVDKNHVELLAVLNDKSSACSAIEIADQFYSVTHLQLPYDIPKAP